MTSHVPMGLKHGWGHDLSCLPNKLKSIFELLWRIFYGSLYHLNGLSCLGCATFQRRKVAKVLQGGGISVFPPPWDPHLLKTTNQGGFGPPIGCTPRGTDLQTIPLFCPASTTGRHQAQKFKHCNPSDWENRTAIPNHNPAQAVVIWRGGATKRARIRVYADASRRSPRRRKFQFIGQIYNLTGGWKILAFSRPFRMRSPPRARASISFSPGRITTRTRLWR